MKKNKNDQNNSEKHGIISIVQSPNEEDNKSDNLNKSVKENKSDDTKEHGIISIVQAPDEDRDKQ
jgi:hypothetical protein